MPYKAKKPCPHAGCRELTNGGYCDTHRREANSAYERNNRDKAARAVYATARWSRVRAVQLRSEPMCRHCRERRLLVAATHVDHIVEIADGGSEYDIDNLQSLCKSCHSSKTLRVRHRRQGGS